MDSFIIHTHKIARPGESRRRGDLFAIFSTVPRVHCRYAGRWTTREGIPCVPPPPTPVPPGSGSRFRSQL